TTGPSPLTYVSIDTAPAATISLWRLMMCPSSVRVQFDPQERGFPHDSVGRLRGSASIGCDKREATVVVGTARPGCAGRSDQLFGEGVTGDDGAWRVISGRLQRHTVDGVFAVGRDIGDAGVFVDAEVVGHGSAGDEFGFASRLVGNGIDRHAHEQLL